MRYLLTALSILLLTTACAPKAPVQKSAADYFADGDRLLAKGLHEQAIEQWEKIRELYYSPENNAKVELRIAEAYFQNEDYLEAATAYADFLQQHPNHEKGEEVLYQLGLSYYRQILSVDRDQSATRHSLATFRQILQTSPQHPNRKEIEGFILHCLDNLAGHELYVGRFYLKTGHIKPALTRLEGLFAQYDNFTGQDAAYYFLGKAYLEDGNNEKAEQALNTLAKRFPESEYTDKSAKLLSSIH